MYFVRTLNSILYHPFGESLGDFDAVWILLPIYTSIYLSIHLSIYSSIYLSIYLPINFRHNGMAQNPSLTPRFNQVNKIFFLLIHFKSTHFLERAFKLRCLQNGRLTTFKVSNV